MVCTCVCTCEAPVADLWVQYSQVSVWDGQLVGHDVLVALHAWGATSLGCVTQGGCVKDGRGAVPVLLPSSIPNIPDNNMAYTGSSRLIAQAGSGNVRCADPLGLISMRL